MKTDNQTPVAGHRRWAFSRIELLVVIAIITVLGALPLLGTPLELRLGSGERSVERYTEYGYNAAILGNVTELARYDSIYPNAIPTGSKLRKHLDEQLRKFEKDYERAKALGIAVVLNADEVTLPIPILERLQTPGGKGVVAESFPFVAVLAHAESQGTNQLRVDFDSEELWAAYRAKYREVLHDYPAVAYVLVRTGENYSNPKAGFTGHTIAISGKYDEAYFRNM